ncbi:lysoplasmalogenase [Lapillicoccus sp.]|uniref:lysoplasmalogenase n=1 Tax=Lapillicoccus sp. TaxID=1909287 RepID=UPI0025F98C0A|nr:lysoplasmalogenase [Lapillicoccus sp.]
MNVFGWVLLLAVVVAAVGDWAAVVRRNRALEQLTKPAVIVLLLAFAWLLHADAVASGRWLLLGLLLSLVGDALLLGRDPSDERFTRGLVAFLLAHLAYLGALLTMGSAAPAWLGVTLVVVALGLVAALSRRLRPLVSRDRVTGTAVAAYAIVLGVVTVVAWVRGQVLVGLGLTLFGVRDGLSAWSRFGRRPLGSGLELAEVAATVTYHLAQVAVVIGVLRPDLLG